MNARWVAGISIAATLMTRIAPPLASSNASVGTASDLVLVDGTSATATVLGQVIDGTIADLRVRVPSDGTYDLAGPGLTTIATATSTNRNATFFAIDFSLSGIYSLKKGGMVQTSFQVLDYGGSLLSVTQNQVVKFTPAQLSAITPAVEIPYVVGMLQWDFSDAPRCTYLDGYGDASATLHVSKNIPTGIAFKLRMNTLGFGGDGPAVTAAYELQGVTNSALSPDYVVLWQLGLTPFPGVPPWSPPTNMVIDAYVLGTQAKQISLKSAGTVVDVSPGFQCTQDTPPYFLTVSIS